MDKSLLVEGLSDAVGFVGGALLGFWVGSLQLARGWRKRNQDKPRD